MGLATLAAIRAMQDSLKMNREQLKKNRKSAKELAELYKIKSPEPWQYERMDALKLEAFKAELKLKRRKEDIKKIFLILSLTLIGILMISLMFY